MQTKLEVTYIKQVSEAGGCDMGNGEDRRVRDHVEDRGDRRHSNI